MTEVLLCTIQRVAQIVKAVQVPRAVRILRKRNHHIRMLMMTDTIRFMKTKIMTGIDIRKTMTTQEA